MVALFALELPFLPVARLQVGSKEHSELPLSLSHLVLNNEHGVEEWKLSMCVFNYTKINSFAGGTARLGISLYQHFAKAQNYDSGLSLSNAKTCAPFLAVAKDAFS